MYAVPTAPAPAKLPNLALGFLASNPVALLDSTRELILLAFQVGQVIVRELAPLLFDHALQLPPIALHGI